MIDREKFKENFVYLDNEVVIEIIDIFLGEYEARLTNIQNNISAQDYAGLKFNAHSLKGVIANFMDPPTIELSRSLDERAKHESSEGMQELFVNLKQATESLVTELQDLKKDFI
ncbi:MAG: Hpt domain-containing protein [Bacteroidales bacterium]|nr:Hpt domain-containing protein [Bacteroidales bacterium]